MVSLRGLTWVSAAGLVLVAVGLGFLTTGAPIVGIGFCALAFGLVVTARRGDDSEDSNGSAVARDPASDDALSTLRERYARGELSDERFEAKLERLLEAETRDDVAVSVRERTDETAEPTRE